MSDIKSEQALPESFRVATIFRILPGTGTGSTLTVNCAQNQVRTWYHVVGIKKAPCNNVSTAVNQGTGTEYLFTTNKDSIDDINVNTSHSIEVS
jgi:hypothetical protein